MARRYTRDARGRFASGGFSGQTGGRGARLMSGGRSRTGGGARIQAAAPAGAFRRGQARKQGINRAEPLTTGRGTLAARASLRRSRANLAANPSAAQRGAVTRANRYATMAKASNRQTLGQSPAGRFVRGKGAKPAAAPVARPQVPARGTLAARSRLRDARGAAAASFNPSTARRLTAANRDAAGAIRANRQRLGQSPAGRLVPGKGRKAAPEVTPTTVMSQGRRQPRIADTLRDSMRALAQSDARFYRSLERDFGIKIAPPKPSRAKALSPAAGGAGSSGRPGKVSTALRDGLRGLAQADARRLRDIAAITRDVPAGTLRGSGSRARLSGSRPRLAGSKRRKG